MSKLQYNFQDFETSNIFNPYIREYIIGLESIADILAPCPIAVEAIGNEGFMDNVKEKVQKVIAWFKEKFQAILNKIKDLYYKHRHYFMEMRLKDPVKLAEAFKNKIAEKYIKEGNQDIAKKVKDSDHKAYVDYIYAVLQQTLTKQDCLPEFMMFGKTIDIIDNGVRETYLAWSELKLSKMSKKEAEDIGYYDGSHNKEFVDKYGYLQKAITAGEEYTRVIESYKPGPVNPSDFKRVTTEILNFKIAKIDVYIKDGEKVLKEVTEVLNKITPETDKAYFDRATQILSVIVKLNALLAAQVKILQLVTVIVFAYLDGKGDNENAYGVRQYVSWVNNANKPPEQEDEQASGKPYNEYVDNTPKLGYKSK